MEEYRDIRQQVIDASIRAQRLGLIRGTSGNISVRSTDGQVIAITPTNIPYEDLTWDMVPLVNEQGAVLAGDYKPSSETPMHTAVMRARKDVNAVVHTHSIYAIVLSMMKQPLPTITINLIAYGADPAPILPFEVPGTNLLGDQVVRGLGDHGQAVILESHGLLTVGKSLDKAMSCTEYINEACEIAYLARVGCGTVKGIDSVYIEKIVEIVKTGRAV